MNIIQISFLAFVQGLTEFLPVSSSGHLAMIQQLMGFKTPPLTLDILLHFATLIATLIFFRKKIWQLTEKTFQAIIKFDFQNIPLMVLYLIVGTIPAVFIGIFLKDYLESTFSSNLAVGAGFFITALSLFSLIRLKNNSNFQKPNWLKSLLIGLAQAIAIMPGISRSGSTIVSARWLKLSPKEAFEFSFLLSIPAVLGATILDIPNIRQIASTDLLNYLFGMIIAFSVGLFALKTLRKLVLNNRMQYFAWYVLGLAMIMFLV